MSVDFDQILNRKGTASLKWELYGDRDVIPMWVADMDFAAPSVVIDRLKSRLDHGALGYTVAPKHAIDAVVAGVGRLHGWKIDPDWLVWLPGLVPALHVISGAFCPPGGEVATFTPIYPPFLSAAPFVNRSIVTAPLTVKGGRYAIDLDVLATSIGEKTSLLLFCNPQNPTGRVFDRDELLAVYEICRRHDVMICSDEIHSDLVLDDDKRHIPFSSISDDVAQHSFVLMAPSKTYNVAGLNCSFAIVPDATIRLRLKRAIGESLPHVNTLGYEACAAAYDEGEPWRLALLDYLRGNRELLTSVTGQFPELGFIPGEATFLAWIDCRRTGIERPRRFFEKAGVGLSDGTYFGAPGFVRLNFGCPRATLTAGLERMARALTNRRHS